MTFRIDQTYSRAEIARAVGGQRRDYLPTDDGRVVCGCFRKGPRWNPGAPKEILFGFGQRVERAAQRIAEQGGPIPVFLYERPAAWRYIGRYRCTGISTDPEVRRRKQREHPQRGPIAGVLHFQPV